MVPTLYMFDRQAQKTISWLLLIGNIVLTAVQLCWYIPDEFRMTAKELRAVLVRNIFALSVVTLHMMYFNNLSGQVHDDVKKSNETMEAATREKETFFATISHEIRNPLQSLQGSVDLLGEAKDQSPEERRRLLEICRSCCALVINMVSNILDMSKIAAGKMLLSPAPADFREIASRILQVSRSRAEGKDVQLELDCDPALPPAIEVDTQRVEQVLLNLVSNSIKFTPSKGRIVVRIEWRDLSSPDAADHAVEVENALSRSNWRSTIELEEKNVQVGCCTSAVKRTDHGLEQKYQFPTAASSRSRTGHRRSGLLPLPRKSRPHTRTAGVVKVEVMDTGIGISKEGAQRLFKPYQQAEAGISRHDFASLYLGVEDTAAPDSGCGSPRASCN